MIGQTLDLAGLELDHAYRAFGRMCSAATVEDLADAASALVRSCRAALSHVASTGDDPAARANGALNWTRFEVWCVDFIAPLAGHPLILSDGAGLVIQNDAACKTACYAFDTERSAIVVSLEFLETVSSVVLGARREVNKLLSS